MTPRDTLPQVSPADAASFSAGDYVLLYSDKQVDTESTAKHAGEVKQITAVDPSKSPYIEERGADYSSNQLRFWALETVTENPYTLGLFILRQSGMERLYKFVTEYHEGWGDGTGRALDLCAYRALFVFLRFAPINVASKPSIFMTPEDGLELAWDDAKGRDIRVEFTWLACADGRLIHWSGARSAVRGPPFELNQQSGFTRRARIPSEMWRLTRSSSSWLANTTLKQKGASSLSQS